VEFFSVIATLYIVLLPDWGGRLPLIKLTAPSTVNGLETLTVTSLPGTGKTLTILGDAGDTVGLKNGAGADQWAQNGTETVGAQVFDVYTNTADAAVKVLIEQSIQRNIDP
jgi:hypothetical protein